MSYEKQTWQTGDVITAVKLNHMEDGIANPGYTVETQAVEVVPEQTVETVKGSGSLPPYAIGHFVLAEGITSLDDVPDTLTITFNGTEYVCSNHSANTQYKAYGANTDVGRDETIDWSVYPFEALITSDMGGQLNTESAGTYTIKMEDIKKVANVSEDFALARGYNVESRTVEVILEQTATTVEASGQNRAVITVAEGITSLDDIPDELTITFQGQEYVCEAIAMEGGKLYGGITETGTDFSQYPFVVGFQNANGLVGGVLFTESAGTYTVKATAERKTVVPSEEFKQAVESSAGVLNVPFTTSGSSITLQSSWSAISTALQNGGARLYSHKKDKNMATMSESESTITGTILNATYSSTRGVKLYGVDAIFNDLNTIKLLSFTTTNADGTGLTATVE